MTGLVAATARALARGSVRPTRRSARTRECVAAALKAGVVGTSTDLSWPADPGSRDWRCVGCKAVITAVEEPEVCPALGCLGRSFALVDEFPLSAGG